MDFALPLLDLIAPDAEPPLAYRKGGEPPRLVRRARGRGSGDRASEAADLDGLLAVMVGSVARRCAADG